MFRSYLYIMVLLCFWSPLKLKAFSSNTSYLRGSVLLESMDLLNLNTQSEIKVYELIEACLPLEPDAQVYISFGWDDQNQKPFSKTVTCRRAFEYFLKTPIVENSRYEKIKSNLYLSTYLVSYFINAEDWFYGFFSNDESSKTPTLEKMKHILSIEGDEYPVSDVFVSPSDQNRYIKNFKQEIVDFCNDSHLWMPENIKFQRSLQRFQVHSRDPKAQIVVNCDSSGAVQITLESETTRSFFF